MADLHDFKDFSSIIAVAIGAAAAAIIRAPQLAIVGLGAFSAPVYGEQALLYDPFCNRSIAVKRSGRASAADPEAVVRAALQRRRPMPLCRSCDGASK